MNSLTYGWPIEYELDPLLTLCVILWGVNPAESDRSLFWRRLQDYAASGGTLIVIDPLRTATTRLADRWLAVRPGTDGALALGMLNVDSGRALGSGRCGTPVFRFCRSGAKSQGVYAAEGGQYQAPKIFGLIAFINRMFSIGPFAAAPHRDPRQRKKNTNCLQ